MSILLGDNDVPPGIGWLDDQYELIRELGRGGMASVYLARDRATNRLVAVKAMRASFADDEEAVSRFAREARTVADLDHPNIVRTYAVEQLGDRTLAIVMEYVSGRTLREALRTDGLFPYERVEAVLADVAVALRYAHTRGIVHRDVKPENIFLEEETGRALLSDFGIARSMDADTKLTMTGAAIGTPTYMSPEQIDGRPVDGRSDVYSLGLVGWEMVAGERPWAGESLYSVIYKQKHEELPRLTTLRPDVPSPLLFAIEGALHKHRDERWADADEFLAQLRNEPGRASLAATTDEYPRLEAGDRGEMRTLQFRRPADEAPTVVVVPPPPGRRRRWPALAAAALLLAVLGFGALAVVARRRAEGTLPNLASTGSGVTYAQNGSVSGDSASTGAESPPERDENAPLRRTSLPADSDASIAAPERSGASPTMGGPPRTEDTARVSPARRQSTTASAAATPSRTPPTPSRSASVTRAPAGPPSRARGPHADSLSRCSSPVAADQRACLFATLAERDQRLNRAYSMLIAELRRQAGSPNPPMVRYLRGAQRAWIVSRDRECARRGRSREGALWAPTRASCLGDLADQRAAQLEAQLLPLQH